MELPLGDEFASTIADQIDVASFYVFQGLRGQYDAKQNDGKRLKMVDSGSAEPYNFANDIGMRPLQLPTYGHGYFEKLKPLCRLYNRAPKTTQDLYIDLPQGFDYIYASTRQTVIATKERHGDTVWPTIYIVGLFNENSGRMNSGGFFGFSFKTEKAWSQMFETMQKVDPLTVVEHIGGRLTSNEGNNGKFPMIPIEKYHQEKILTDLSLIHAVQLKRKSLIKNNSPLLVDFFYAPNGFDQEINYLNNPITLRQIKFTKKNSEDFFEVETINETPDYKPPAD